MRIDAKNLLRFDRFNDGVGVVALVGNEVGAGGYGDEQRRLGDVMNVAGREVEMDGISEGIHQSSLTVGN